MTAINETFRPGTPAGDRLDLVDMRRRIKAIFIGSVGNLVECTIFSPMPPSPSISPRHSFPIVGWDRGADRASNDADVSSIPPIIPYGGFSPVRLEGWPVRRDLPSSSFSLSQLPACAD